MRDAFIGKMTVRVGGAESGRAVWFAMMDDVLRGVWGLGRTNGNLSMNSLFRFVRIKHDLRMERSNQLPVRFQC